MWRWLRRIFYVVAAIVVLAVVSVEIVLQTDLPRNLVLDALQKRLQLRVTAQSLRTGWLGHATLKNVTLSLPLDEHAFLSVPTLRVKHTAILAIAIGRPITIQMIELDKPMLVARQDEQRNWNILEVADLLGRVGGSKQAANTPQTTSAAVELPIVHINDGTIVVKGQGGHETQFPFSVSGQPDGLLVWQYDVRAGVKQAGQEDDPIRIVGKLAPGGVWAHELRIHIHDLEPMLQPWWKGMVISDSARELVNTADVGATWQGQADGGKVTGLLKIDKAAAAAVAGKPIWASGAVGVTVQAGVTRATPHALTIHGLPQVAGDVALNGGSLVIDGAAIRADKLAGEVGGGNVNIAGRLGFSDGVANLNANWQNVQAPPRVTQSGSIVASMSTPFLHQPRVEVAITSIGSFASATTNSAAALASAPGATPMAQPSSAAGNRALAPVSGALKASNAAAQPQYSWDMTLAIAGRSVGDQGGGWDNFDWTVSAQRLRITKGATTYNLDQTTLAAAQRQDLITLTSVKVPAGDLTPQHPRGTLDASATYSLASGDFTLSASGGEWRLGKWKPVSFKTALHGDKNLIYLDKFHGAGGGITYDASGQITLNHPNDQTDHSMPMRFEFVMLYPAFSLDFYHSGMALTGSEFESRLTITGDANRKDTDLVADATFESHDLNVKGRPIGNVTFKAALEYATDPNDRSNHLLTMSGAHMALFKGNWNINGDYDQNADNLFLHLTLDHLALEQAARFAGVKTSVGGMFAGDWAINVPDRDVNQMTVDGTFHMRDVKSGPAAIETVDGRTTVANGTVRVHDVIFHHEDQGVKGTLRADLRFQLKDYKHLSVDGDLKNWPLSAARDAFVIASAQIDHPLSIDLTQSPIHVDGQVAAQAQVTWKKQDLGRLTLRATARGTTVAINEVDGAILGGKIAGSGYYDETDWHERRGNLAISNLDAADVVKIVPALAGLQGKFTGTFVLAPNADPRILGRQQLDITLVPAAARYKGMEIGRIALHAYYASEYNDDQKLTEDEYATDPITCSIQMADGTVHPWIRVTHHLRTDKQKDVLENAWSAQIILDLTDLDLDQLVRVGDPKIAKMPGKLSGSINILGDPTQITDIRSAKDTINGEVSLKLRDSNLANYPVIRDLYNLMSLKGNPAPTGTGYMYARLEGANLSVPRVHYFNRGVEVLGSISVTNIYAGKKAPLAGYVVGTVRPLRDLKLPFAADIDKVLTIAQKNLTSVQVGGNLGNPTIIPAAFSLISGALKQFIAGDATGETAGSAAR